ncbi:hypothetical protein [[Acholeplasma] multilocale]|uniref:hypothetical protein n=1 Tax=[Acholeplasma] multilocale TaxID=264638 RepID=UPI00047B169C|nr:hypothetical protein [[Acholeplasma] multilocale]
MKTTKVFWFNFESISDLEFVFEEKWFKNIEVLTDEEKTKINNYLKAKWKIINIALKVEEPMLQKDFQIEVLRQFGMINGRLDKIEDRLDKIETRLDVIEGAISMLNEAVFGINALVIPKGAKSILKCNCNHA